MLKLTNADNLTKSEALVFNVLKQIVERTVVIYRCKADGTIINNHSPIEDKHFLKIKIEQAILDTFPGATGAFEITVHHPSKGEHALHEVMEQDDSEIEYSIELNNDLPYYIELIRKRMGVVA